MATDPETSRWLISFQGRDVYRTERGVSSNAPVDSFILSSVHPAVLLADAKKAFVALEGGPFRPGAGPQSTTEVLRIYSAVEVPPGTLSEADEESLEEFAYYVW